ncbi:UreD urease accessory protein-domain-containing protein [Apodospora peruviana]|uniref:UreD urease accessory protein-domain-containing protein n=1 Tax=Apodospora peruviana TaxID=516989 RepID=A0AAE0II69_9PEZI|nr:UreD urease accessory protein-domain-containing protein [Apodospora peruviana]
MESPFPKSSSVAGEGRIVAKLLPDGISGLETITYQYPLKLITPSRPSELRSVLVFLLSYGGGLVGGDNVDLSIVVEANAKLSIVTQGHTKVFKSASPDIVTRQTLRVHVAPGAALCLLPDPVQPFEGSVYEQTQIFKVAKDSSLCLLDWVTQGRTARGEDWSFVRWIGRNEVWSCADVSTAGGDRLLVRDAVILDGNQAHPQLKSLRESMQSMGVVGTLLLRGPLVKTLGEFFLAEFAALPRLGSRDFHNEHAKKVTDNTLPPLEKWRLERLRMEKETRLLWSAAHVRGCVVVKFGAPAVEAGRLWIGSMLAFEGSRRRTALTCTTPPSAFNRSALNVMTSRRQPLMETSDNTSTGSPAPTASARRSGRVTKAPEKFSPDAPAATKRKRAAEHDDEDVENESPDDVGEVSAEDSDASDTAAEDEPQRPKKKSSQSAKGKKPAAKKPKINGDAPVADANHAPRQLVSRPKKTVRLAIAGREAEGLYADIFGSGDSSDKVATDWYHKYQADDTAAVTDLVNCILSAAGCDQHVTGDDIRDPENCQNRLADLQNVYADVSITDYPLISRAKTTRPFRDLLIGFFKSLVTVMHETDVLYKDATLMENIARWVASMSSSTLRPFRHTATTVALAMEAALVDVAKKLDDRITRMTQQIESEKARKGKNKERLVATQKLLDEANQNREMCQEQIGDFFETVFVHRYRDIDPKIRTECVEALGSWIWHLPTVFMEPEYLRYLGWMLSDVMPPTRQEVLKQLARIFKRDAEKLGHFIDRFRPRLVEMATKDSDVSVRVAAVAVIQILKDTGMLEPDEIDSIGRLIFDSELRVRRAVLDFFAGCVNDSIENKVESMGGQDVVDELFGDDDEDDYFTPRRDWIAIKCLAELLAAYDAQLEEENNTEPPRGLDIAVEMIQAVSPETRISLASQALYEKIDQVKNWELLSGYLLYDHTASSKSRSSKKGGSNEAALRDAVAPEGNEEPILLEVLASAVRSSLAPTTEGADRSRRRPRADGVENAEDSAVHLATIIPRLLKKFGAEASTAVVVLRLEHCLDLDIFQQLRQDSTTYRRLLDEICTQFDRHVDRGVLSEATAALLHARKYDELEELTDAKISELWENVINALRHFDKTCELGIRANLDADAIAELGHVLVKMSKLASIANCIEVLEAEGQLEGSDAPAIEILARIVARGKLEQVDEALDDLEDEAVSFAIKCCQFYFMWQARALIGSVQARADIPGRDIERLNALRKTYETNLIWTLSSRGTNDDLRLFATGGLCDLHVVFATLRQVIEQQKTDDNGGGAVKSYSSLEPLLEPIANGLIGELVEVYDAAERAYARCIKRALNEPAVDEDPIDDDLLSDDDENDAELTPSEKKGKELKAERALCELAGKLVLTILAEMVDHANGPSHPAGKLKRRMLRNQNKLGNNLKETLAYLDEGKLPSLRREKKKKAAAAVAVAQKGKGKTPASNRRQPISEEIVVADDDSDDDEEEAEQIEEVEEEEEHEEGTVEDLRRRELLDDDPIEDDDDQGSGVEHMDEDEESVLGD